MSAATVPGLWAPMLVLLLLSACASTLGMYNPSNLPHQQLAYVEAQGNYPQFSLIVSVFDAQGRRVLGTNSWVEQDRWSRVYLEAGRYRFVTLCQMGTHHAFPEFEAELAAGENYAITCRHVKSEAIYGSGQAMIEKADLQRPSPKP